MTDLEAAVGMAQIGRWDEATAARRRAAEILDEALYELPGIHPQVIRDGNRSSYYVYGYRVDEDEAGVSTEEFSKAVKAEGIPDCNGAYIRGMPLYKYPLFAEELTYGDSRYPFVDEHGERRVDYNSLHLPNIEQHLPTTGTVLFRNTYTEEDAIRHRNRHEKGRPPLRREEGVGSYLKTPLASPWLGKTARLEPVEEPSLSLPKGQFSAVRSALDHGHRAHLAVWYPDSMTTVSTIEDIISAMRDRPEVRDAIRREILTEELLSLPEKLDRLTQRMDDLTVRLDTLTQRMDDLTVRLDTLTQRMDDLTVRLDTLTQRMDDLTVRLDTLTQRMDDLTAQVAEIVIDSEGALRQNRNTHRG